MKDSPPSSPANKPAAKSPRRKRRWRRLGILALFILAVLIGLRLALPTWVRGYVNRTLDRDPLYKGSIGDIDIHLWRGGYTINNVRLDKTTGNVPVPFFSARKVNLQIQWNALFHGKVVGQVLLDRPVLNFVDSSDASTSQTGGGGPWMQMITDLFPFKINSAAIRNGTIHFRAFDTDPPVDVYLSHVDGAINNLTNIHDDTTPLIAAVEARGLAMDQAKFEYHMKLDPFSYHPTFELGIRLVGLDVTQINALARAYGNFDFQRGFFDLVIELNARDGTVEGYVKPLFRNLQVLSLKQDIKNDDPLTFFWEALVGLTAEVFKNQNRDQFGTVIPLTGTLNSPRTDFFTTIGNVLRNAFIRAYLPRYQGVPPDSNGLQFGQPSPDPTSPISGP